MERSLYAAIEEIRHKKRVSLYLLYGNEDLFAAKWLAEELKQSLRQETGVSGIETARFPFSSDHWEACLTTAYQGDLFSSHQIVMCTGFELVTSQVKAKSAESALAEEVIQLFQDPPASPVVFHSSAEKLDERKKLTKQFLADNRSVVIALHKFRHDEWKRIVMEWAGDQLTLSEWQIEQLELRCAGSLSMLRQEMDKLNLFAGTRRQLADDDFMKVTVDAATGDLFAVIRSVMAKKPALAYEQYKKLDQKDSFFAFLALLARQYRLVLRIHAEPNIPDQAFAKILGVHPYGVKVARDQARVVSFAEAEAMLQRMNTLEFMIKSGQMQEKSAVEWFFLKMLQNS